MDKKVIITIVVLLVIIVGIVVIVKWLPKQKPTNQTEEVIEKDETLVKINEQEFHLDKEAEFKDLKYTIVGDFKEANMEKYIQYNYLQEDSSNLLYFRIFDYDSKSIEEAAADLGIEEELTLTDGKTENIEYKLFDRHRDDGTIHFYFLNKEGKLYVLNFVSKYDIKDFEEKVLNSINFK